MRNSAGTSFSALRNEGQQIELSIVSKYMATTSHQLASKWLTLRLTICRLVPDELDQLQCFPRGWTNTGMSDGHRAFCMGNALVTGIPHEIGKALVKSLER